MTPEVLADWGQRVRERRASITQEKLAELARVDQSTISRLERGQLDRVSDDLKWKIAGALGTTVATLFPYPNVRPPFPAEVTAAVDAVRETA